MTRESVTLVGEEQIDDFHDAVGLLEDDHNVELTTGRGKPDSGEITKGQAVRLLARAYLGLDPEEVLEP